MGEEDEEPWSLVDPPRLKREDMRLADLTGADNIVDFTCIAPTSSIQEGIRIRIRRFRVPLCKGGGWEGGMDRRYSCGIGAGGALPGAARLVGKTEKASSRERCSKTLRETKDQKILRRGIDRELAGSDKS